MPVTINVNNLSLVHKKSGGIANATLPDVCKTPSPGGPVPIPYPNVAVSANLKKGTLSVKVDGGASAAIKGSEFFISSGDEPGVLGGIKSGTHMKEATWLSYSLDVKFEGRNACRLSDKMLMNHGNTVCLAGILNPPLLLAHGNLAAELQTLCNMMCDIRNVPGQKQTLIHKRLSAIDRSMGFKSTMKTEVPYNMDSLEPYMSTHEEGRASQNWFRPGHRRPDVVVTDGSPPVQGNIRAVIEMKFKGDSLSQEQRLAYEQIAGDPDNFIVMEEDIDCLCDDQKQERVPVDLPVPVPAYTPEKNWWEKPGVVAGAAVMSLATVGLLLLPFDGPAGELAAGSTALRLWTKAFAK